MHLPAVRSTSSLVRQCALVPRLARFTFAVGLTTASLMQWTLASMLGLAMGAGSAEAVTVPGTLYGVSYSGLNAAAGQVLFTINPADGAILTQTGFAGGALVSDVAAAPDGTLYGLNCCVAGNSAGAGQFLLTLNPADGAILTQTGFAGGTFLSDIAAAPNGTLYGLNCCVPGNNVAAGQFLFTINPTDGAILTQTGFAGGTFVSSIAFAPDGTLYGVNCCVSGNNAAAGQFLFTINPTDGAILTQTGFAGGAPVSSIAFAPDGTLYGVNLAGSHAGIGNLLFTINPADGAILTQSGFGTTVSGITFAPIPEPGTGVLVMVGLAGLAYRQRRNGRAA